LSKENSTVNNSDRAPIFGSWRRAYFFALAFFAVEVVLLYIFTVRFS
jgi:hypothetical protein